jgi:hypothetical protein
MTPQLQSLPEKRRANVSHRYNSVIFESLSYNDYWTFVGPSDFDAQQIRNLTTPGLENCFGTQGSGIFFGGLDDKGDDQTIGWDKIAQLVLEGKSEAISTQQCYNYRESSDAGHFQSGYKGLILLSSDLSMEDGGDIHSLGSWYRSTTVSHSLVIRQQRHLEPIISGMRRVIILSGPAS